MSDAPQDLREPAPPRVHRAARTWFALLLVWGIGLCFWAGYIALLFVGFLRVFS
jgi:hypothetical protein